MRPFLAPAGLVVALVVAGWDAVGPYLRSLITRHHDTFATPVR
jgi:hypothetical protein